MESYSLTLNRTPELDKRITLDPFIGELLIFDDDGMIIITITMHSFLLVFDHFFTFVYNYSDLNYLFFFQI